MVFHTYFTIFRFFLFMFAFLNTYLKFWKSWWYYSTRIQLFLPENGCRRKDWSNYLAAKYDIDTKNKNIFIFVKLIASSLPSESKITICYFFFVHKLLYYFTFFGLFFIGYSLSKKGPNKLKFAHIIGVDKLQYWWKLKKILFFLA